MKHILFIITSCIMLNSCYRKCKMKDAVYYGFLPEMQTYFGMYKNGSWWVYLNQDSTKRDSVYISNFIEDTRYNLSDGCYSWPRREFVLNTTYLFGGNSKNVSIYDNQGDGSESFFHIGSKIVGIASQMDIISRKPKPSYEKTGYSYVKLKVLGNTYDNVFKYDDPITYVAPKLGIISYIIDKDTFLLINYKIN